MICQNHEKEFFKFCVFLRKSELYPNILFVIYICKVKDKNATSSWLWSHCVLPFHICGIPCFYSARFLLFIPEQGWAGLFPKGAWISNVEFKSCVTPDMFSWTSLEILKSSQTNAYLVSSKHALQFKFFKNGTKIWCNSPIAFFLSW